MIPLKDNLAEKYGQLTTHRSPVVVQVWGVRERKNEVSVTAYPTEQGPMLAKIAPNIRDSADAALYEDVKKKHFPEIAVHTEDFLAAWQAHADACCDWVKTLSEELLDKSQLPEQSNAILPEYMDDGGEPLSLRESQCRVRSTQLWDLRA